jgi:hypothetical protein
MAVRRISLVAVIRPRRLTIALRESAAHPAIALVIHPLNHHAVPFKGVSYVVSPSTVLQPLNLMLSAFGFLLRLLKLFFQLLDLTILLRVALFLSVLFAPVCDAFPQSHRRCECADKR